MQNATPEPAGSPLWEILSWLVIAGFVVYMFVSQAHRAKLARISAENSTTATNLQLGIAGWTTLAETQLLEKSQAGQSQSTRDKARENMRNAITVLAVSPLDKLKAVVMTDELQGSASALHQLDDQTTMLAAHPTLAPDARILRQTYTLGPKSLTPESRAQLLKDLGWFGQLAVTQGQPAGDPGRAAMVQSAQRSLVLLIGLMLVLLAGIVVGLVLLILMIVLFVQGKMRFRMQPPPGIGAPVFLETFALWCLMYLLLALCLSGWKTAGSTLIAEFIALAATMGVCLWPLARGMQWDQLRRSLGWHRGAGVFTEIGAGLLGYVAGLPILAVGFGLTLFLIKISNANPTHPISQEMAAPITAGKILSLLLTASVAAPILEESVFRGALYFHLRRRWRPWLPTAVVSLIFAAIHPQGWSTIPVLGSIAIVLALLREWRGSLLASITLHGVSNGIVLAVGLLMLK